MKRFVSIAVFAAFLAPAFSLGVTLGPFAYEADIIEDKSETVDHYGWGMGLGAYHKINIGANAFYYVDLDLALHFTNVKVVDSATNASSLVKATNLMFYLHNDINYYPFHQRLAYFGAGLEGIAIGHIAGNGNGHTFTKSNSDFQLTFPVFVYVDAGVAVPVGRVFGKDCEVGLKLLYRVFPFVDGKPAGGEASLTFGFVPKKNAAMVKAEKVEDAVNNAVIVY
jgi:hypothetical protein